MALGGDLDSLALAVRVSSSSKRPLIPLIGLGWRNEDDAIASHEEHLRLSADCLDLIIAAVILIIDHENGFLHLAKHQVAVAIIGMEATPELAVAAQLDTDDLVQQEADQVKGLSH